MQLRDTDHEKQGLWLSDHKINKIQRFTYFKPNLNNIVPWGEHWKTTEILSVLFSFPRSPLPVWQHLILTNTLSHNLKPSLQVSAWHARHVTLWPILHVERFYEKGNLYTAINSHIKYLSAICWVSWLKKILFPCNNCLFTLSSLRSRGFGDPYFVMRDSLPRSIWEDSTFWIWISQWILPNTFNYSEPLTVTACQTDTVSAQIRSPDQILLINPLPPWLDHFNLRNKRLYLPTEAIKITKKFMLSLTLNILC